MSAVRLFMTALLGLSMAACGGFPGRMAERVPAEPVVPILSGEAQEALAKAEADVKAAMANFTLWVVAEQALKNAREAAGKGDSASVIREAEKVAEFTRLGTAQAEYPSAELK
jgi:hypothetical protein